MLKSLILGLCLLCLGALVPAGASGSEVDVELILAVDSSASVNWDEFNQQMTGLAEAFEDNSLQEAIAAGKIGAIGVALVEWSGAEDQRLSVPWAVVDDVDSARAFAKAVRETPRHFDRGGTSISGAIRFALNSYASNRLQSDRRVIDISGDGRNSAGPIVSPWRDKAVLAGVVINGLPILNEEADLEAHFLHDVIGGEGAFTVVAKNYDDYRRAILIKLIREIRGTWYGV